MLSYLCQQDNIDFGRSTVERVPITLPSVMWHSISEQFQNSFPASLPYFFLPKQYGSTHVQLELHFNSQIILYFQIYIVFHLKKIFIQNWFGEAGRLSSVAPQWRSVVQSSPGLTLLWLAGKSCHRSNYNEGRGAIFWGDYSGNSDLPVACPLVLQASLTNSSVASARLWQVLMQAWGTTHRFVSSYQIYPINTGLLLSKIFSLPMHPPPSLAIT